MFIIWKKTCCLGKVFGAFVMNWTGWTLEPCEDFIDPYPWCDDTNCFGDHRFAREHLPPPAIYSRTPPGKWIDYDKRYRNMNTGTHLYMYTHTYVYIYIYICVCDILMKLQYHGNISIASGPSKITQHFPMISDRQEARPLWGVPVQAACARWLWPVPSQVQRVQRSCNGCCWMLIYGHLGLPKGVHPQESSSLSSCF